MQCSESNPTMYLRTYLILLLPLLCYSLNILVSFPHSGKSHFLAFEPLFKALARKGHKVTVISYFPQKKPIPNYRDIVLQNPSDGVNIMSLDKSPSTSRLDMYLGVFLLAWFANNDCPAGLENSNFQNFLKEDNKFDVVLVEVFNTNCFMGLVKKFKAPVIGMSSCTLLPWVYDWLGSPQAPSYIPNLFLGTYNQLTFIERVENTILYAYTKLAFKYILEIPGNEYSKKYLGEDVLEGDGVMYNMSLFLSNTHFSLSVPRPLVPGDIEVAGLHIGSSKKLPLNIEKWITDSPDGVIYFSLGSLIKGHTFPKDKREAFLKAFKRLPQRVLWKWENETMEGKPDNVMIQKWMPQFDILSHPNVKAFISHGGLLGITEAVHCGVPTIVMPQFGDQHTNAKALEASGGGVILQLSEATEDKVYKALKKVLSADSRQKAQELSERFRDRPLPPLDTAIYWVEYVARHKGAHHMKTAAVNMPFYKYYLIDVAAFLILIISAYIYVTYKVIKYLVKLLWKDKKTKIKSS